MAASQDIQQHQSLLEEDVPFDVQTNCTLGSKLWTNMQCLYSNSNKHLSTYIKEGILWRRGGQYWHGDRQRGLFAVRL